MDILSGMNFQYDDEDEDILVDKVDQYKCGTNKTNENMEESSIRLSRTALSVDEEEQKLFLQQQKKSFQFRRSRTKKMSSDNYNRGKNCIFEDDINTIIESIENRSGFSFGNQESTSTEFSSDDLAKPKAKVSLTKRFSAKSLIPKLRTNGSSGFAPLMESSEANFSNKNNMMKPLLRRKSSSLFVKRQPGSDDDLL
jgi:hypothetical protein